MRITGFPKLSDTTPRTIAQHSLLRNLIPFRITAPGPMAPLLRAAFRNRREQLIDRFLASVDSLGMFPPGPRMSLTDAMLMLTEDETARLPQRKVRAAFEQAENEWRLMLARDDEMVSMAKGPGHAKASFNVPTLVARDPLCRLLALEMRIAAEYYATMLSIGLDTDPQTTGIHVVRAGIGFDMRGDQMLRAAVAAFEELPRDWSTGEYLIEPQPDEACLPPPPLQSETAELPAAATPESGAKEGDAAAASELHEMMQQYTSPLVPLPEPGNTYAPPGKPGQETMPMREFMREVLVLERDTFGYFRFDPRGGDGSRVYLNTSFDDIQKRNDTLAPLLSPVMRQYGNFLLEWEEVFNGRWIRYHLAAGHEDHRVDLELPEFEVLTAVTNPFATPSSPSSSSKPAAAAAAGGAMAAEVQMRVDYALPLCTRAAGNSRTREGDMPHVAIFELAAPEPKRGFFSRFFSRVE